MTPKAKKYTVFVSLFALWLAGDLWTKDWADRYLSEPSHPASITATEGDASKTLAALVGEYYGMDEAQTREQLSQQVEKLPAPMTHSLDEKVFDRQGPHGKVRGYYAFWRGIDMPPVFLHKYEPLVLHRWVQIGSPKSSPKDVSKAVWGHLNTVSMGDWLGRRILGLAESDAADVILYAADKSQAVNLDAMAQPGTTYLVRQRIIDVMGDWFKFRYRENPGAAFGFMRDIEPDTRSLIFLILTLVALAVIGTITFKLPPSARLVNIAMAGILAGALGNFINRLQYEYVIDFIDMDLGFYHWPTYNIADMGISLGVILLLLDMLFNKESVLASKKEDKKKSARQEEAGPSQSEAEAVIPPETPAAETPV